MKKEKKEFKPQIITFKKFAFERELSLYNERIKLENTIEKWFSKYIDSETEIDFKGDILEQAKTLLLTANDNVMNLTAERYASLKEIPLQELNKLQTEYNKVKRYNLPNESDFCVMTANEIENERLKIYYDFVIATKKLKETAPNISLIQLYKPLEFYIDFSHAKNEPTPRMNLIKR
jgi:hypothetical protein